MPNKSQPGNETPQPIHTLKYILGGTVLYAGVLVTLAQLFVTTL